MKPFCLAHEPRAPVAFHQQWGFVQMAGRRAGGGGGGRGAGSQVGEAGPPQTELGNFGPFLLKHCQPLLQQL